MPYIEVETTPEEFAAIQANARSLVTSWVRCSPDEQDALVDQFTPPASEDTEFSEEERRIACEVAAIFLQAGFTKAVGGIALAVGVLALQHEKLEAGDHMSDETELALTLAGEGIAETLMEDDNDTCGTAGRTLFTLAQALNNLSSQETFVYDEERATNKGFALPSAG